MSDKREEQVLTLAEQYREQLEKAEEKTQIRERMEWYRESAAKLFRPGE
jgi:uncharacterized protein YbgA (DUF1722 family)